MSRDIPKWKQWLQYLSVQGAVTALASAGVGANLNLARLIARAYFEANRTHRECAFRHIWQGFPSWSRDQVESVALGSFEHFFQLMAEVYFTRRLVHPNTYNDRVVRVQGDRGLDMLYEGRPVLLVTGHFGNWEALGYFLAIEGHRICAVARPLDNPLLNAWLLGLRRRRGLRIIQKWGDPIDQIMMALHHREAVGFIADQNAGDGGMFVPFFRRLASTHKTIGVIAARFNLPVVCGYARRVGPDLHYEIASVDIIRPADWSDHPSPSYYVTARFMRAIENMVRQHPEQYLWMHRRWKSRPRHERLGRPMPPPLRRNLEALPWMNAELLGQLDQRGAFGPHDR